ncbi:MAG: sulfatase-like hydrolase/transferase [Geminicoccaceae bacterium]
MSMPVSRTELAEAALRPGERHWLRTGATCVVLLAASLWLSMLWNLPVDIRDFDTSDVAVNWPALVLPALNAIIVNASFVDGVALEIVLLVALIALVPALRHGRTAVLLRHAVAVSTLLLVVLCLTDLGVRMVLGRPFAPLLDLGIYANVVDLQKGSFKGMTGWFLTLAQVMLGALVYGVSLKAVGIIQRTTGEQPFRCLALGVSVGFVLFHLGTSVLPGSAAVHDRLVHARASTTVWRQVDRSWTMLAALNDFEGAIEVDQFPELPADRLLAKLGQIDVLLVFFESYGRSALSQARFRTHTMPALRGFGETLVEHGLGSASAYLTSPTMGGQSWLAHSTLESGLWLAHQSYYDALMATDRLTLTKAFAKRGHRTVALKPAIIMPWPEGPHFGFEQIYAAADMGYAGLPYNWATMPDQYTLAAFEQFERQVAGRVRPVFAEFSLISSHAPWTHIPPLVQDWSSIGDGAIFSKWAEDGDPPHVVWADPARIREQYAKSVRYVLDILASYASEHVDENTLMIVVGDHQPAPLVTGEGVSRDVPMHVIAGDPALLTPFFDWGFVAGLMPDDSIPVRRMDAFRDWFLDAYSE